MIARVAVLADSVRRRTLYYTIRLVLLRKGSRYEQGRSAGKDRWLMGIFACHGDIVYASNADRIESFPNHWIIVDNGAVIGVYSKIPEKYTGIDTYNYGNDLIIPAFSDLHVHASQYCQRGLGMDKLLFDWLNDYTFPQEARFSDHEYAQVVYGAVINDFIRHGTFHVSAYATIHRDTTDILFELLEQSGMAAFVGKVNMDRNSPHMLCETTQQSLRETEIFLGEHTGGPIRPILTPRFTPTCSEKLLFGLGKLAKKYHCPMQTHLVESGEQATYAMELFPDYSCEAEIYLRTGLLENPAILAHVIFPTEKDIDIMAKHSCLLVHCPDATVNITAGIMPFVQLTEKGLNIAFGSDIGGGHGIPIYRQIGRAIQLSKLKQFYEPEQKRITLSRAFYHATKEGGAAFGRVGSFEPGYYFDALILSDLDDTKEVLSPIERLERFCYIGDDRNIKERFLSGKRLTQGENCCWHLAIQ